MALAEAMAMAMGSDHEAMAPGATSVSPSW
jgi:hypothetical protein